ncbi:hypothetical protein LCGC14_2052250 [marine sediment metagenome]|uniref:Uncharacterized protein n=1 Tax=marine sediment metagenome TaxID=412755 RepID=A0A0F9H239_9ZZZZ
MDSIQLLNELAAEAERDGLPVTAEGCREVAREIERLNLELAEGKFREEAVCGYCSHSGSLMLTEIERLRSQVELEKRNVQYRDEILGLCPDGDRHASLVSTIEQLRAFLATMPHGLGQYEDWKSKHLEATEAAGKDGEG